ncbi:MAG: CoA transferase [Anaerolineae bacterium]|nr:CoA transferase [Gemmatimonadaceae bacterium]
MNSVKVVDFTRVLAGPLCSMMLGDLGANVIKVERPDGGDETRGWGPPFDERGESAYFLSVNRNKKSVVADLRNPADRDLLLTLIQNADVVLDNFRPGSLDRAGLPPDEVTAKNESLIWCSITGFGGTNARPGYDFVIQAESGWMSITGPPEGPPAKAGVALADVIAGKDAVIAVLAALVNRGRTGRGSRIVISLSSSARAALVNVAQNVLVSGLEAGRWGNAHPNLVPYQLFDCSDRPIVLAVGSNAQWRACATVLDLHELADDERLAHNAGRLKHRSEVVEKLARRLRQRSADSWIVALDAVGVPCGIVKSVKDAISDAGASPLFGVPPSVPGTMRFPPPRLDEHGDQIRRLGWGAFDALHR